ncbi:hypothetical protein [uncultured Aquitalea sp.]|uniref:hypothetical protein n=1 Tax=uncultured Aquitalea sp. TaxID=540272 RepID=UPI0025D542D4|nr:hypothetical protein [uncultured Aquitalea sp.]
MLTVFALLCGLTAPAVQAAASERPVTDQAGNVMQALALQDAASQGANATAMQGCTADGTLCLTLESGENGERKLSVAGKGDSRLAAGDLAALQLQNADNLEYTLWPYVITLGQNPDSLIVGVLQNARTMYSGGGANQSNLLLLQAHRQAGTLQLTQVLGVQDGFWAMIRACFSERDMRQRAGACHDEYTFNGRIALDAGNTKAMPRLIYRTRATSFPGTVSRQRDSLSAPPLRKKDIVQAVDKACSYRRVFTFDEARQQYLPNRPLPACDDYQLD